MDSSFHLFPHQASETAGQTDLLAFFLLLVSVFFALLICTLIVYFAIKYRRRSESYRPPLIHGSLQLELLWTIIPLLISLVIFGWGAKVFVDAKEPPKNAMEIYVTGKQWMWKIQHVPSGQREINALHVPRGQPIKLTMTSEDVIHDFSLPAFRCKQDVVPGRYTQEWFTPSVDGEYHIFCAQYCGSKHAEMIGTVTVMEPQDYQRWLNGGGSTESPAVVGAKLFSERGCITCHGGQPGSQCPPLAGVFGGTVRLDDGRTVTADEDYVRESILYPQAKIVAGYPRPSPMPAFLGQLNEEQIIDLIAYVKSLAAAPGAAANPAAPAPVPASVKPGASSPPLRATEPGSQRPGTGESGSGNPGGGAIK
jgi:cytochrome c oxidase subunit 2